MDHFNQYQYDDLLAKSHDVYAHSKYELILRYLADRTNLHILNVGCGSGELSFLLAQLGHHVIGIDPAEKYIAVARKTLVRLALSNCSFLVSSVEEYEPTEHFDCVISTDVLEHIEHDRVAFTKMAELVAPGSTIIVTVPAGPWLFGYHDKSLGHFRRYTRPSLRQIADGYCQIERLRYFGFSLIPISYLYSKVLRKPYPVADVGDTKRKPFVGRALRFLLQIDKRVPLPFGTSLIMKGIRV